MTNQALKNSEKTRLDSAVSHVERVTRIAIKAGNTAWPLSTSEILAAALILNQLERFQMGNERRSWTPIEAIERIGPDWVSALPIVADKLLKEGLITKHNW